MNDEDTKIYKPRAKQVRFKCGKFLKQFFLNEYVQIEEERNQLEVEQQRKRAEIERMLEAKREKRRVLRANAKLRKQQEVADQQRKEAEETELAEALKKMEINNAAADPMKRLRKAKKRLRQIENLAAKVASEGLVPNEEQKAKLESRQKVQEEISELELQLKTKSPA